MGYSVKCGVRAGVLPVQGLVRRGRGQALPRLCVPHSDWIEDYHILQTTRDEYLIRQIRNGMDGAGVPVEFSKGEAGRGQHEINLRYADALDDGRPPQRSTRTGRRRSPRSTAARSRSWRSTRWTRRGSSCHIHSSLWSADGEEPYDLRRGCARPHVVGLPRLPRRAAAVLPRAHVVLRPVRQLVQAVRARFVGADRGRVGPGQPHVRAAHRRPRPRPAAWSPGSRGPTATRTSRSRRRSPPGWTASNRASTRAPRSRATRTRPPTCRASRPRSSRRSGCFEESELAAKAFGEEVHYHLRQHGQAGVGRVQRRRSPTGS